MENLIKPVDYAKKMGISRQAVYAKIKKGILPSRNVGGKIYIVLEEPEKHIVTSAVQKRAGGEDENFRELLAAKEETIAVLKETIRDLKETNQMITSTLRSEVELLKEAFGEMKTLYAARLEHVEPEAIVLTEFAESDENRELDKTEEPGMSEENRAEWIRLEDFFREQRIEKKKLKKRFMERVEKLYRKGHAEVRREKGKYLMTPKRAAKLLSRVLEK